VLIETFAGADKDFTALAQRIKAAGITHMALAAFPSEAALLVGEVKQQVPGLVIFATDTLADDSFGRVAGTAAENMRIALAPDVRAFPRASDLASRAVRPWPAVPLSKSCAPSPPVPRRPILPAAWPAVHSRPYSAPSASTPPVRRACPRTSSTSGAAAPCTRRSRHKCRGGASRQAPSCQRFAARLALMGCFQWRAGTV
jgi:hypothetical protein